MGKPTLAAFQGYGIEMEYMIVDAATLAVKPICEVVLRALANAAPGAEPPSEVARAPLAYSNELVAHVLEMKTDGPATTLRGLGRNFLDGVRLVNQILKPAGAMLLGGAMHPFMDPMTEMVLWPYGDATEVYRTYHAIFDCRGHGWANLQSVHINLPFANDQEFGSLHAAIRLVLPILPALAASSPIYAGRVGDYCDNRLAFYRGNQKRIPQITGQVIPERAYSAAEYQQLIFAPMYQAIAPHDPKGELQYEWLNSRGAIARFDRHAIEIRVLDIQENPLADAAIVAVVSDLVESLYHDELGLGHKLREINEVELYPIFDDCARHGGAAIINNGAYLKLLGLGAQPMSAREAWQRLLERLSRRPNGHLQKDDHATPLQVILQHGTLAERIVKVLGKRPGASDIKNLYLRLASMLALGESLVP